ncbi:MAG TPA: hypothetical protein VE623_25060 [Acidimicrobiales bacterium]|jgi:hypothetical protein|nr:hypothetical protein [Acidimicrobiales bacterium]
MLFRRKSRKDRMMAALGRLLPSRRTVAKAAGVISSVAALTAASSSVSALRQKQS